MYTRCNALKQIVQNSYNRLIRFQSSATNAFQELK
jgi:hypothetical protein